MRPLILFAHGAGKGSDSPWMVEWAERLGTIGRVVAFDYPYKRSGRHFPDKMPTLIEAHRDVLRDAREGDEPVILAGKSMGSRVGCHLSLEEDVDGLVCFGYPLVSGGKTKKLRNEVLEALSTPILFVQGTRDKMSPLDTLAEVQARMSAPSGLHVVETGDHSLKITKTHTKTTGVTQEEAWDAAQNAVQDWVAELLAG